ncbi:MAG: PAS domain-containing protein [Alphaproteobacteria bacterium]
MTADLPEGIRFRLDAVPRPDGAYEVDDGTLFDPSLRFLHPALAEALTYWSRKRGGAVFPTRADIDPLEIPALLRHVLLFDRVECAAPPGYTWRFRLVGTTVAALYGEHTGKVIEDALAPRFAARNRGVMEAAVERHAPMRAIGRTRYVSSQWLIGEALVAPLSSDGKRIDMLLSVVVTWAEDAPPREVRKNWQAQKSAGT